ncbi:MAG: translation initiation factor IF-2 [Bacteroidales bacterium]|nr:translation initiation factor IF-2 [Bacteroidales bacterium]
MSEETKSIRLSKAAKEFNIGVSTAVEFLRKKGHQIDDNPNTKISEDLYDLLAKNFQSERAVKENADKIQISTPVKKSIVEADKPAAADTEATKEDSEIIIKNFNKNEETSQEKSEEPAKPAEKKTKKTEKKTKDAPAKEKEEAPAPAEEEKPAETEESFEPKVITSDDSNLSVKVVKKIDLESINEKNRPSKKTKEQKEKERKERKKNSDAIVEAMAAKAAEEQRKSDTPQPEATAPEPEPEPKKEPETIKAVAPKLEGPKILGKIDLPTPEQRTKPSKKEEGGRKKKRKRIGEGPVDINNPSNQGGNAPKKKEKQSEAPAQGSGKKRDKKAKAKPAVVIDEKEIEKQIHDNLARLAPMGKSKTSKHRREKRKKIHEQIEDQQIMEMESQNVLKVTEFVTANDLATMMNKPVNEIISTCFMVGIPISINQRLGAETIQLIAEEFGFQINFVSAEVVDAISEIEEHDSEEDLKPRNPIVTVMGHVDHGKTSLLDYIRKTNVIAGEAGGITQHIGAYEVEMPDGRKITFLDTPGHEAFTAMRARGASITDIAIIVIAADDKVMPQTIEAINHAQAANVPIVFAINKIDKPGADPDRIKTELANMNYLVEEWGGKYQSQDIAAKKGINIDELLEKVLLEAEMLDLKANPNKRAKGTIIESSLDKGRGYVAKILVQDGTIRQGDPVVAGSHFGRVKAMYNERNQIVKEAGPSTPVLLLGLDGAPQAGDTFNVMENEKEAKEIATRRHQLQREQTIRTQTHITLDEIGRRIALGDFKELNLIVKGDVDGSVEALSDSLLKLSTSEVQVKVILKGVGQITESDVQLAIASNAVIIGFQVRPSLTARKLAEAEQIDIRLYSIIYTAINELKDAIEGMLSPEIQEKVVANLEVLETFRISKVGTIAGCMCLDGKINKNTNVRVIRDGIVVYTGKLASLKRFKDEVKEVVSGQDCGLNIENFNDIKVGDIIEGYEQIEIKRKL